VHAIAAAACVSLLYAAPDQTPFHAATDIVPVYATVRSADGHLITNLQQQDFEILERGTPVPIAVFSNDVQPITVAIMLDMSGGLFDMDRYALLRDALIRLIDQLTPQDRARIGTFDGSEIATGFRLTSDHAELKRVVAEEVWPHGGRRHLWNAIGVAMRSLKDEPGRRVVLVLVNGPDSIDDIPGLPNVVDVEKGVRDDGFMIYALAPFPGNQLHGNPNGDIQPRMTLPELVDLSGGGFVEAPDGGRNYLRSATPVTDPLLAALPSVINELRHQYALGFVPRQRDGREGRLEVRVKRQDLMVTARKTYRAPSR
jgi:hypothetical protein